MTVDVPARLGTSVRTSGRPRSDLWLLAPPVVLAALGTALLLRRPSLWYDELFTAQVAPVPLRRLVEAVLSGTGTESYLLDIPPSYNAPYYAVVHGWLVLTGLEPGEIALRSLSLLCAVAACAVLTAAVARLGGRPAGLAAGLLVATNPLVLEYAVEARGYGMAMLAVAATALGLARWLTGGRLLLYGVAATGAGLAHWFALPVVAGLSLAGLLLRGRRALPLLAVSAAAAVPALALVALALTQDTAGTTTGWVRDTGGAVPRLSLQAWTAGSTLLLACTLLAAAAGLAAGFRRPGPSRSTAVVALCWTAVPLLVVTAAELVRPVYVPRYLLPALLGLAVLAAGGLLWLGAAAGGAVGARPAARRLAMGGPVAVLVGLQLVAATPLLDRGPREDARGAVAALAGKHSPGEPVVAVDRRAALALEHYADGSVRADLLVPPDDAPAADVVWLLRQAGSGGVRPSDDDQVLRRRGLRPVDERVFRGSSSLLVLQRWSR